jgi:inorganic pyrophosphatase
MDILVVMEQPTFPGCIIETRVIGVMRMIDGDENDDKILW